MVYKGKINGCTGFKMGKELKSMSVMIVIPMGIEKNGVVLSGVMGLRCMNVIGHQDGRRGILERRAKWTASWTERRAGAGDGERLASGDFELRRAMVWAGAMGKSIWTFIGLAFMVLCHIFLDDLFIYYLFIIYCLLKALSPWMMLFFLLYQLILTDWWTAIIWYSIYFMNYFYQWFNLWLSD